jgi:TorA maturation chaperone TorD
MTQTDKHVPAKADWLTTLTAEALVFGLLGKALYAYPDRVWIQSLADEGVFEEAPLGSEQPDVLAGLALLQAWMEESHGGMPDDAFDALRSDYTSLFIGPGKVLAPPWESVYFNDARMVFQEQTLEVRTWYRRFGLEAEKLYQEPDDHIGLELAFLAHLARLGVQALERHDQAAFDDLLSSQRAFLSQHPLKWGPPWCSQVAQQARTAFYRGIALLTRGMLLAVASVLQDGVPGKAAGMEPVTA